MEAGEDWVNELPAGRVTTSSQLSSGSGTSYGVSIRLLPCSVATPVNRVIGVISVEMSEKPTNQVGAAAPTAAQSSSGSRSIAVSPPHGGTTARIAGSTRKDVSSAARSAAGALTCVAPSMQAPTTTSRPRRRSVPTATSRRARWRAATPLEGEVTPTRSPGRSGAGKRRGMRACCHATRAPGTVSPAPVAHQVRVTTEPAGSGAPTCRPPWSTTRVWLLRQLL